MLSKTLEYGQTHIRSQQEKKTNKKKKTDSTLAQQQ